MKQCAIIQSLEAEYLKADLPQVEIGDTLEIHQKIIEGGQDEGTKEKERIQLFTGTLVAVNGSGLSTTLTLYKISHGSGVQRVFSAHSPKIAKIVVKRKGKVRRSKLYYLCGAFGKKSKVKESRKRATIQVVEDRSSAEPIA